MTHQDDDALITRCRITFGGPLVDGFTSAIENGHDDITARYRATIAGLYTARGGMHAEGVALAEALERAILAQSGIQSAADDTPPASRSPRSSR